VVGRRLYQRKDIELSFAVKKQYADGAKLTMVKQRFEPADGLRDVAGRVQEVVTVGKGEAETSSEKEMRAVSRAPRSVTRTLMWAQRTLDYFNLLPAGMIRNDPLYASMVVANLGSVGLHAAYHHLYEYGTVPLFAAIGAVHRAPVVDESGELAGRRVVDVRYTFDERITDGWYAARSLERFKGYVEDPARLEEGTPEPVLGSAHAGR